jgi:Nuclease-related domain/AAA domain
MKIIPSTFAEFPKASPGERDIFQRLKKAAKGEDWIVLHSLELLTHINKSQSEADFVVMIPGVGILVLEVKAAKSVSHDENGWKIGAKFEKRGPFKQANEAMRSIMEYLETMNIDIYQVPFVYAVWFTHVTRAQFESSISWRTEQVLTSEDLKSEITDVLLETTKNLVSDLKINFKSQIAPPRKLEEISQILLPRFTANQSPVERQKDVKEFLEMALQEQLQMVRLISNLRAVVLQGLAGTGKTYIAIHAARLAHERGEKVLFLCYNSMLADYLKTKMLNYPLVKVTSFHALMLEIAELDVPEYADDNWWESILPGEALKHSEEYAKKNAFDTVILDEAQDLGTTNFLLILDQFLNGGLSAAKKILVCGDFAHQGVYVPGIDTLSNFKNAIPDLQVLTPLLTNCRNTKTLGEFLLAFLKLDPEYDHFRRENEESIVKPILTTKDSEILPQLRSILTEIMLKFTPDQIVILSPQRSKLEALVSTLKLNLTQIRTPKSGHLRWGSVQEFKGLEALAVVLIEFEGLNPVLQESFYVGATRSIHDFFFFLPADKVSELTGE